MVMSYTMKKDVNIRWEKMHDYALGYIMEDYESLKFVVFHKNSTRDCFMVRAVDTQVDLVLPHSVREFNDAARIAKEIYCLEKFVLTAPF